MKVESMLSEEGIARASKNRTIFNRAVMLVMEEHGLTREDVLNWLSDDSKWVQEQVTEFTD